MGEGRVKGIWEWGHEGKREIERQERKLKRHLREGREGAEGKQREKHRRG